MFGCNNDRLFPEIIYSQDNISNTKLGKGDHYYIQTRHKNIFSHYNLILRERRKLNAYFVLASCALNLRLDTGGPDVVCVTE